jgi:lysozyme family protein
MTDLNALARANAARWADAKLVRKTEAANIALHLFQAKKRYQTVEASTGVPWPIVAVIHEREASQKWNTQLGQGDPLDKVSVHVPAGRGPFKTWEDGAYDALVLCPPFLARRKDWSLAGSLIGLEGFNGYGYANQGRVSPYVWSGTSIYDPPTGPGGKVLVDHGPIEDVYPSGPRKGQRVVDPQLGCAALLMALMQIDPTVTFTGATITPIRQSPLNMPAPTPVPPLAPATSFWGVLVSAVLKIFGRK